MEEFFSSLGTTVQSLSIFLTVVFLLIGIYLLYELGEITKKNDTDFLNHFKRFNKEPQVKSEKMKVWENIASQFNSSDPELWKIAIINADALLEEFITSLGYPGETFGEKLKAMQRQGVSWVDSAWDVHLTRNKIAHQGAQFKLNNREAFRAFKIYESILLGSGFLA